MLFTAEEKKERARVRARAWYYANQERARKRIAAWQKVNPDKIAASKKRTRDNRLAGQRRCYYARRSHYLEQTYKYLCTDKRRAWAREYARRRNENPQWRRYAGAMRAVSCLLKGSLTGKGGSVWVRLLGCSPDYFRQHLAKQFLPGMNWENRGKKRGCWQVDHIKSASSFDLTKAADLRDFFHYRNTRPLWADDNNRRRA